MLAANNRLRKNYQFNYIYKHGNSVTAKNLSLIYTKAKGGPKIGFSVSNKVGKAVVRNRIRRRMRESVRAVLPRISGGYNMIFAARPDLATATSADIQTAVDQCLKKAGLYRINE